MKKIITVLMSCLLVLVLVGCGGSNKSPEGKWEYTYYDESIVLEIKKDKIVADNEEIKISYDDEKIYVFDMFNEVDYTMAYTIDSNGDMILKYDGETIHLVRK